MMADTMAIAGAIPGIGIEALALVKHLRMETIVEGAAAAADETVVTDMAGRLWQSVRKRTGSPVSGAQ